MTRLSLAIGATVVGTGLWFGSLLWRWRIVEYRPGPLGSASRNIDGAGPGVGLYLVGMLALVLLVAAVLFAGEPARGRLRPLVTAFAGALGIGLVVMAATLDRFAGDSRIADVRPGPAFLLAAGAVLALLTAVWTAPPGAPGEPEPPGGGWFAGIAAVVAGLAALLTGCYLPLWRNQYPDMEIVTDASEGFIVLVPTALVSGLLATASLTLTGYSQRTARRRCRRWLILTAAGCGGLLTLLWLTLIGDSYAQEHGLRASYPGEGILLTYLGHLLIAAGGAIATRRPPATA
ncbi:hypothetical protein [Micromonospora sp. CPCC 206061]|uniref:hypothetical protein n=1 Tax=Micromonospora sp. CPCC 206061 TaxID=3122410 RepID=UPI002FF08317